MRFAEDIEKFYAGGLCFTHDMGNYTSYSPEGYSGYEMSNTKYYSYMTTEELLNGIYCMASYAISTKDTAWLKRRAGTAEALLISLENRDNFIPSQRTGILKGESSRCGENGHEITTYDALDHSLQSSIGNIYIAVKTMCGAIMLSEYFELAELPLLAARAESMAEKTAECLEQFFVEDEAYFKANLFIDIDSKTIAAIEPLAVPLFLGLSEKLLKNKALMSLFKKHIKTCLKPGNCLEQNFGGLKLSSTSENTWPSKVILCIYVMEELFDIDLKKEYPSVMVELKHWFQVSASELTVSDQILCGNRKVIGGSYYPRHITSALWAF